jgi:hypothetical protein
MKPDSADFSEFPSEALVRNLTAFIARQLQQQGEGDGKYKQAIVHVPQGIFLADWKGEEFKLKRLPDDCIRRPYRLGPLLPAHPPNFDFCDIEDFEQINFPLSVAYSVSRGALSGRCGVVMMNSLNDFDDECCCVS